MCIIFIVRYRCEQCKIEDKLLWIAREYKKEAIECYQTILENFPDTALAPKASQALKKLGVEVVTPSEEQQDDGSTTGQAADITDLNNTETTDINQNSDIKDTVVTPAEQI